MKEIAAISRYTIIENVRNRIYYILVFFFVIVLSSSMFLSVLGGEEAIRVFYDFGLVSIELFALLMIVFSGVSLLLEEMDSKIIYLILVRPFPRYYYLLGRYFGLFMSVFLSIIFMGVLHLVFLLLKGWVFNTQYLLILLFISLKIALIGALAVFFSLFSTSNISSLVFTMFLWLIGHFTQEVQFLINKITSVPLQVSARVLQYIIPNLQYFNLRELSGTGISLGRIVPAAFIYGVSYSAICVIFAIFLFKYKEF